MLDRNIVKVGDKVNHRFRPHEYPNAVIIEIEHGCNGRIKVQCTADTHWFCIQDLSKR